MMLKLKIRLKFLLLLVIILLLSCISIEPPEELFSDMKIALYNGEGASELCIEAMTKAFEWMGCSVDLVSSDDIKNDVLINYDVVAWSGGEIPHPFGDVGIDGKEKIQAFIKNGGAYLGICAGAMYACDLFFYNNEPTGVELNLDLFPGVSYSPIKEISEDKSVMTNLKLDRTHPIVKDIEETIKIVYFPGGPYFEHYEGATNFTIIAEYESINKPAAVVGDYGNGRYFLIGPHPEIEVDGNHDGSWKFSSFDDEGSEWPLLLNAVKWITNTF